MNQRNVEIDCLRAFAIIMTVYMHYVRLFLPWRLVPVYHSYETATTFGHLWINCWTGVDLFLVISGYVISKTIVTGIDQLKISSRSGGLVLFIKAFYVRRIFRIYPLAWLIFFFVLIASMIFNKGGFFATPENNLEAGVSIFTYTFNYFFAYGLYHGYFLSHYWSLSLEEQFYLLLPFFLVFTHSTKTRVTILVGILLLITFVIRPLTHGDFMFLYTQTRCDGLIYGCLIYFLTQQKWFSLIRVRTTSSNRIFWNFLMLLLVVVLAAIPGLGFSNNFIIPIACIISSLLVISAAFNEGLLLFPRPIQQVLNYFGSRSYALYIVHFPMFAFTQEIFYRLFNTVEIKPQFSLSYTLVSFCLIFMVTEILHRYVEIPFMNRGKKVSKNIISREVLEKKEPTFDSNEGVLMTK